MITVEQAREELERLGQIIAEAERIRPRWNELSTFIQLAERLSQPLESAPAKPLEFKSDEEAENSTPATGPGQGSNTAELAAAAISKLGKPTHIRPLTQAMYGLGWRGTGETLRDEEIIRKNLRRKPHTFANIGGNTWALIASQAAPQ